MTKLRGDDDLFALLDVMGGENAQINQGPAPVVEEDQSNADASKHRCSSLYFRTYDAQYCAFFRAAQRTSQGSSFWAAKNFPSVISMQMRNPWIEASTFHPCGSLRSVV